MAASHYEATRPGEARKILQNFYAEPNPTDPQRPIRLVPTPGTVRAGPEGSITGTIRGMDQADGHAQTTYLGENRGNVLIVDGNVVRKLDPVAETFTAMSGMVAGVDRVQWAFAQEEAACLGGGTIHVSTGTVIAPASDADWATLLSDHSQSGFTSIATLGQRLIASYGDRIAYSTALDFNATTTLNFYTAESSPDGIVALFTLGSVLWVMGRQTLEPWFQTGVNDDPLRTDVGAVIQRGCLARDTIAQIKGGIAFIGDDYQPYWLSGGGLREIGPSDKWLPDLLREVAKEDIICSAHEASGHAWYLVNTPNWCVAYDMTTQSFHKRQTYTTEGWEWAFHANAEGKDFVGSRTGSRVAVLTPSASSDYQADADTFGTEIVRKFSFHLSALRTGAPIGVVRLDADVGIAPLTGDFADPQVLLQWSKNKGQTFSPPRSRSSGSQGQYNREIRWERNGRARPEQVIGLITRSDPIRGHINGVAVGER